MVAVVFICFEVFKCFTPGFQFVIDFNFTECECFSLAQWEMDCDISSFNRLNTVKCSGFSTADWILLILTNWERSWIKSSWFWCIKIIPNSYVEIRQSTGCGNKRKHECYLLQIFFFLQKITRNTAFNKFTTAISSICYFYHFYCVSLPQVHQPPGATVKLGVCAGITTNPGDKITIWIKNLSRSRISQGMNTQNYTKSMCAWEGGWTYPQLSQGQVRCGMYRLSSGMQVWFLLSWSVN